MLEPRDTGNLPSHRAASRDRLRVLELYCGIGGCAAALGNAASVVAAVDINRLALGVYAHNFPHPAAARTLESLTAAELGEMGAELWWMSPPCQPFTRRGRGRDDEDPRSRSFLHLMEQAAAVRPPYLALENVPTFQGSRTHGRLLATLAGAGYQVGEHILCPSQMGMPNRRRRYYLVASQGDLAPLPRPAPRSVPLAHCLDPEPAPELWVGPELPRRYPHALHIVDAADPEAVTACFTSAYGRSHVRSGSYLRTPRGLRRFSPTEILRLLGFPPTFSLPPDLPLSNGWRLVGNSLSLPPVRAVLRRLPPLAEKLGG